MTDTSKIDNAATDTEVRTLVWPTLRYADARAAIHWLVTVLGFGEQAVYGDGDRVDHAQLVRPGGGGIMLGSARDDSAISQVPAGTGSVYVVVETEDELRRLYDAAVAAAPDVRRLERQGLRGSGLHLPRSRRCALESGDVHRAVTAATKIDLPTAGPHRRRCRIVSTSTTGGPPEVCSFGLVSKCR